MRFSVQHLNILLNDLFQLSKHSHENTKENRVTYTALFSTTDM